MVASTWYELRKRSVAAQARPDRQGVHEVADHALEFRPRARARRRADDDIGRTALAMQQHVECRQQHREQRCFLPPAPARAPRRSGPSTMKSRAAPGPSGLRGRGWSVASGNDGGAPVELLPPIPPVLLALYSPPALAAARRIARNAPVARPRRQGQACLQCEQAAITSSRGRRWKLCPRQCDGTAGGQCRGRFAGTVCRRPSGPRRRTACWPRPSAAELGLAQLGRIVLLEFVHSRQRRHRPDAVTEGNAIHGEDRDSAWSGRESWH